MKDCVGMTGKPQVIRFEMGTGFISTKIVVETGYFTHPIKEDVKKKISPLPSRETRAW